MNRIISLIFIFAFLAGCSTGDVVINTQKFEVEFTGVVRDNTTRQPLKGVLVETMPESESIFTDSAGKYLLKADKLGLYKLSFGKPGYFSADIELDSRIKNKICFDCDLGKVISPDAEKWSYIKLKPKLTDTFRYSQYKIADLEYYNDYASKVFIISGEDYPPSESITEKVSKPGVLKEQFISSPRTDSYKYVKYVYPSGMVGYSNIASIKRRDAYQMLGTFPQGWKLYIPFNRYKSTEFEANYLHQFYYSKADTPFDYNYYIKHISNFITQDRNNNSSAFALNTRHDAVFEIKSTDIQLKKEMTLCFWFNSWSTEHINTKFNCVFNIIYDASYPNLVFGFRRDSNALFAGYRDDNGIESYFKINTKNSLNTWQFITMSVSGRDLKIYCNAELSYSGRLNSRFTLTDLNIFCGNVGGEDIYNSSCLLDDISVFDRALTLEEIIRMSKYYCY